VENTLLKSKGNPWKRGHAEKNLLRIFSLCDRLLALLFNRHISRISEHLRRSSAD
jgi:hypothetical protein